MNVDKSTKRRLVVAGLLGASCPVGMLAFSRLQPAPFPAYRRLSKVLIGSLASLSGMVPVAIWDILVVFLAFVGIMTLVARLRTHRPILPWVSRVALVLAIALALFVDGWALNHYAPPLASDLELEVGVYGIDELEEATRYYLEQASDLAPQLPRDEEGSLASLDFFELACIAGASYEELGKTYEVFQGTTAPVKALIVWGEPLLYSGHVGMFWAPTGEAGVPLNCASAELPFIMCHEAAHRLCIASEQEANFAAYLACESSSDVRLRYSGSYNAFVYCLNALSSADIERARHVMDDATSPDASNGTHLVLCDYRDTHEHYEAYKGTFKKVGRAVNDGYLKSFDEAQGVRSYGLVVDYLIAWQQQ